MSEIRKKDHIQLAIESIPGERFQEENLHFEPLFSPHPDGPQSITFLDHNFALPLWVSSMTGGTKSALKINQNLAKACNEFKMGMGLGSCRSILASNDRFEDFNMRPFIGDRPLYANLGIAQLEEEIDRDKGKRVIELINKLNADGLIIHVNPLQEYFQPEGDKFKYPPIDTIKRALDTFNFPIMVKEVGQGFGPRSLKALINLPLIAVELAAFGGTNFTKLEQMRSQSDKGINQDFSYVGHTAEEMVNWINSGWSEESLCKSFIISGGIKTPLEGYSLMTKLNAPSIVGMASTLLKHAQGDYQALKDFIIELENGFNMAKAFMKRDLQ